MTDEELTTITKTVTARIKAAFERIGHTPSNVRTLYWQYQLPTSQVKIDGIQVTVSPTRIQAWDGRNLQNFDRGKGWTPAKVADRIADRL